MHLLFNLKIEKKDEDGDEEVGGPKWGGTAGEIHSARVQAAHVVNLTA